MAEEHSPHEDVVAAVARAARRPPRECADPAVGLWNGLGIDSLSLLGLIKDLEQRFQVSIPDEDTGQASTVGDLVAIIERLAGSDAPAGPTR